LKVQGQPGLHIETLSQSDFFFFGRDWGLNSGLCTCKPGALPIDPHLQSILLWLFWRWGLENYFTGLASNCNPPDLSLPRSWNYRREPPALGSE
jgi:hypothetical protein